MPEAKEVAMRDWQLVVGDCGFSVATSLHWDSLVLEGASLWGAAAAPQREKPEGRASQSKNMGTCEILSGDPKK